MLTGAVVEVTFVHGTPVEQRSFFSVSRGRPEPVYVTLETVAKNKNLLDELFEDFENEINHIADTMKKLRLYIRRSRK